MIEALGRSAGAAYWHPVRARGLTAAWVGVHSEALGDVGRPWVWDVVTNDDRAHHDELRNDPLALAVDQDIVVVALRHDDDPDATVSMQVLVDAVPDQVDVSASALPKPPWRLELQTGWSTAAIGEALATWLIQRVGPSSALLPPRSPVPDDFERYEVGPDLWASSSAFDTLLERDPRDSAMITECLGAVVESLDPWRRRAA